MNILGPDNPKFDFSVGEDADAIAGDAAASTFSNGHSSRNASLIRKYD